VERNFAFRSNFAFFNLFEDAFRLFLRDRLRLRAAATQGTQTLLAFALTTLPCFVVHNHFHQNVTREELALRLNFLAFFNFNKRFRTGTKISSNKAPKPFFVRASRE
jgi:hypothetical protein